jgi:hypothetical protein
MCYNLGVRIYDEKRVFFAPAGYRKRRVLFGD